ncbi:hypothetical protein OX283_011105 [Flavobacterium sp. SUN052]|uniref:hypothetical protein n=1 Tax=Flavobacterium sp. SUN052 TaxID=3002441 RepID=UPI00237E0D7A|nr:hypothetical protein [Flavobacterium sp. SUN052]MEC4005207.1 hypothetical protein [Flavobacterium sp. SUN052]
MFLKIVVAFLFSLTVYAQQNEKPYPFMSESEIWLNNYRNLKSDSERLVEIKKKIVLDTLYYNYKDRLILDNPRNPEKHICKTLFYLKHDKDFIDLDLLENPKLINFIKNLKLKNIETIELLENTKNAIYFGSNGMCGVIILECSEKFMTKFQKKIK